MVRCGPPASEAFPWCGPHARRPAIKHDAATSGRTSINGEARLASGTTTSSSGLAERYANALYAQADETGAMDATVAEMELLGRLIDTSPEFRRLIESPLIDVNQARLAAGAVLQSQGFGKLVQDFVGVVANNRRLGALRVVVTGFAALVAAKRGIVVAHVSTAHPLTDVQREQLRARMIEAGYGTVNIDETVDPALLGGMVVRVGARLYDTSLKSRLQRLQYAMKGAA